MQYDLNTASWETSYPYENVRPLFSMKNAAGVRLGMNSLNSIYTFGGFHATVSGITEGNVFRFHASFRKDGDDCAVTALLAWLDGRSEMIARDYAYARKSGEAYLLERIAEAPRGAVAVRIELFLGCKGEGRCELYDLTLADGGPYRPRFVKLATTYIDHSGDRTFEMNMQAAEYAIERAAVEKPDIVVLTECARSRNVNQPLALKAIQIPGPVYGRYAALAQKHGVYIAVSELVEEDGYYYNTAMLFGRSGELVGKYKKVHLPLSEREAGVVPGDEFPVFDTDFGRVGMLVCWDHWFPEAARLLYLKGAEVICIPTAGFTDWQSRACAADNGAYVVTACFMGPEKSRIIGPEGDVLAYVKLDCAVATVDLNKPSYQYWFSVGPAWGENRGVYFNERMPQAYGELCKQQ